MEFLTQLKSKHQDDPSAAGQDVEGITTCLTSAEAALKLFAENAKKWAPVLEWSKQLIELQTLLETWKAVLVGVQGLQGVFGSAFEGQPLGSVRQKEEVPRATN